MFSVTAHAAGIPASDVKLLDYFAARAPKEIAPWFRSRPEPFDGPALPVVPATAPEGDRNMLNNWLDDGCFDLPEQYKWFEIAVLVHYEAVRKHKESHELERYYQWPWAYANSMLFAREMYLDQDGKIERNEPAQPAIDPRLTKAEIKRINAAPEGTAFTYLWRNKFLCTDAKDIEEFHSIFLESSLTLARWKRLGVVLAEDGGTDDDYATFVTYSKEVALAEYFTNHNGQN